MRTAIFKFDDGTERPAIVVREWSPTCVNLQVLLDGPNDTHLKCRGDTVPGGALTIHVSSVVEGTTPGTFRRPPLLG